MLSLVFKLLKPTVIDFEAVTLDASKESHVEFRISKSHQLIDKFTVGGKAISMLYTKAHVLSKMYNNFKNKTLLCNKIPCFFEQANKQN